MYKKHFKCIKIVKEAVKISENKRMIMKDIAVKITWINKVFN